MHRRAHAFKRSLNHVMPPYANALAISLLSIALLVLALKDQRCSQQPAPTVTTNKVDRQTRPFQQPMVTPQRRELRKF